MRFPHRFPVRNRRQSRSEISLPGECLETRQLLSGDSGTALFGALVSGATIEGDAWTDYNGNGQRDQEDTALPGRSIELLNAVTASVIEATLTDADGHYQFDDLPAGTYFVRAAYATGWVVTSPVLDVNSPAGGSLPPVIQEPGYEVTTPPTGTKQNPALWYPDLTVDVQNGLADWYVEGDEIRFGQATPNVGHGPMQLVGGPVQGDGTQLVYQRIFNDHGGYVDVVAGYFVFHPEHNHIHFEGYADYALRAALPDSDHDGVPEVGDIVRIGAKTSFCLLDVSPYDLNLPNASDDPSGYGCSVIQQISVGWEDIYGPTTEGQAISIVGLPAGQYWLEAVVDPDNHLQELDETNNYGRVLVTIGDEGQGYTLTVSGDGTYSGNDFGLFEYGEVSGTVFNDLNENGQNDSEPTLVGQVVFLDTNGDGLLNNPVNGDNVADPFASEPWAIVQNDGSFTFSHVAAGTYEPRLVLSANDMVTTPLPDPVTITSGQVVPGITFGVSLKYSPEFSDTNTGPLVYRPATGPLPLLPEVEITDADSDNFAGGSLIISLSDGQPQDQLFFQQDGFAFPLSAQHKAVPRHGGDDHADFGVTIIDNVIRVHGVQIGQVTPGGGLDGAPLIATFNSQATSELVTHLLQQLAYTNAKQVPTAGERHVQIVLTDGDGTVSDPLSLTVHVLSHRDAAFLGFDPSELPAVSPSADLMIGQNSLLSLPDGTLAHGVLTVTISHGAQRGDKLGLLDQADSPVRLQGKKLKINGVVVGRVSAKKHGARLQIEFQSNSSAAQVSAVLDQLVLTSKSNYSTIRTLQFELSDKGQGPAATAQRQTASRFLAAAEEDCGCGGS